MIIVSCGIDFLDDNFYVIFKWNLGCRNNLDGVDWVGFDRNDGERLDCGSLEYNGIVLRSECSAGER